MDTCVVIAKVLLGLSIDENDKLASLKRNH